MFIRGNVKDTQGTPLLAVAVFESNATGQLTDAQNGTITDNEGNFGFRVIDKQSITFRYLGYKTLTFPIAGDYYIIELQKDSFNLPLVTIRPERSKLLFWLFLTAIGILVMKKK